MRGRQRGGGSCGGGGERASQSLEREVENGRLPAHSRFFRILFFFFQRPVKKSSMDFSAHEALPPAEAAVEPAPATEDPEPAADPVEEAALPAVEEGAPPPPPVPNADPAPPVADAAAAPAAAPPIAPAVDGEYGPMSRELVARIRKVRGRGGSWGRGDGGGRAIQKRRRRARGPLQRARRGQKRPVSALPALPRPPGPPWHPPFFWAGKHLWSSSCPNWGGRG